MEADFLPQEMWEELSPQTARAVRRGVRAWRKRLGKLERLVEEQKEEGYRASEGGEQKTGLLSARSGSAAEAEPSELLAAPIVRSDRSEAAAEGADGASAWRTTGTSSA